MKHKGISKSIIALAFVICFARPVLAQSAYSWYFKPTSDGTQPSCTPEADFVSKYNVICLGSPDEKKIYLTFDAGYENGNVEKILDIMKKHNVPSAFFVLPQIVRANTDLVVRMKNEGHLICNHTKSHRNMSKVSDLGTFKAELSGAEDILRDYTGFEMDKFYRPPEGAFSETNLAHAQSLGYTTVFWSLAHADWDDKNQPDPKKSLERLISRTHNGCVLLLHPQSATNAAILEEYIVTMKERGYEFASISELVKQGDAS